MERDARTLAPGTTLETALCIVGAGPAGLTVASEFMRSGVDVIVLESGGTRLDRAGQDLNEGSVIGDPYDGLRVTRHRQVLGTTNIWNTLVHGRTGGKYAPLDPRDLARTGRPMVQWPFDFTELLPWYVRAQALAGLGPFRYDAADWQAELGQPADLGEGITHQVYQFGTTGPFAQTYRALRRAANVRVLTHATGCRVDTGPDRRRVLAVHVRSGTGGAFTVRPQVLVLAAGAVENARLLLAWQETLPPGESAAWAGRCFMEHPRDSSLTLLPHRPEEMGFYQRRTTAGDLVIAGRIGLGQDLARQPLPNASVSLLPVMPEEPRGVRRMLSRLRRTRLPPAYRVLINLEQAPHPENRIELGTARDSLGLPRPVLSWRWRPEEQAAAERLRRILASALSALGAVAEEPRPIDPNAHHHAGTTRMHRDPAHGVVDPDGRVHGMENLYVAGASVFPTAGWANPTLSVIALALRLGDHLRQSR